MAVPHSVALRLLGAVGLRTREVEHRLGGRKIRIVLASLGLRLNQTVPVGQLIADVWGEAHPATARNTVQVYLSGIRRALETTGHPFQLDRLPGGYRLSGRPEQVDWLRFELLAGRARTAGRNGEHEAALSTLTEALLLWEGAPLADIFGSPLHTAFAARLDAARLGALSDRFGADLALGTPGLVAELAELVAAHPLDEQFTRHLMHALANDGRPAEALALYAEFRDRLFAERGVEPSVRLTRRYQAILTNDRPDPVAVRPVGPVPPRVSGDLIGREIEVAQVLGLLTEPGLVTLTGPPGVGKSRLAAEVMARCTSLHPLVVRLDAVSDAADVGTAVADACGPQPAAVARRSARERIRYSLVGSSALLVLDNCEHVAAECADLWNDLLSDGSLRVLATSTRPLHARGETTVRLSPLAVPPADGVTAAEIGGVDSVALFCARARALRPAFVLTDDLAPAVGEICRLVDGIPLSLELAGSRTQVLSPAELAERLGDQLQMLRSVPRRPDDRHDSLVSAVAAAVAPLDADERTLFARLSVFSDSFTLRAAEAVAPPGAPVIDVLHGLVDASLLVADVSGRESRFRMLESVRQFGRSILSTSETAEANERRAVYLRDLADRAAAGRHGPDRLIWRRRLDGMRQDLRHTLDDTLRAGRLDIALPLVAALGWWWSNTPQTGLEWYRRALSAAGETTAVVPAQLLAVELSAAVIASYLVLPEALEYARAAEATADRLADSAGRMRALQHQADIAHELGDLDRAREAADEAWQLAAARGEPWAAGRCGLSVAYNHLAAGAADQAERWAADAAGHFGRAGDEGGRADARLLIAEVRLHEGAHQEAEALLTEALEVFRAQEDDEQTARAATLLADAVHRRGARSDAEDLMEDAFDHHAEIGHPWAIAHDLDVLASVCARQNSSRDAAVLLGAADAVRTSAGLTPTPYDDARRASVAAACERVLGQRGAREAVRAGATSDPTAVLGDARSVLRRPAETSVA
ncbi:BTAD domain-containing putative transcriptional regulator [Cryptosporangium sp. NPDC051539]|uniref:BTAD domain-containing putative transcriptional regulator n=1 Tax=Cryptosporangium sp. NPDC051539 TaxID=3363962 RepID=UPI0037B987F3